MNRQDSRSSRHQMSHHPQQQPQPMLQQPPIHHGAPPQQMLHSQQHQPSPQQHHQPIQHQPQQQPMMHHAYDSRPSTSGSGPMMGYQQLSQTSQQMHMAPQQPPPPNMHPQPQQHRVMQQHHRNPLASQLPSLNSGAHVLQTSVSAPPSASTMGPPPIPGPSMHRTMPIAPVPPRSEPATPATLKRQREDQAMMPPPKKKHVKRDVPPSHRIHEYEKALDLTAYIRQLETLLQQPIKIPGTQVPAHPGAQRVRYSIFSIKGIYASEEERMGEVSKFYNTDSVGSRKWLLKQMTDESDSESDGERSFTADDIRLLLKIHKRRRSIQRGYLQNPLNAQYTYYGAGLISSEDRFPEHQASVLRQHGQGPPPPPSGASGSQ
ncbi:hypothetical protein L596_023495 [Steinernema carpocapsae]|uniref:Uncharacterized protein n=1 Tax=Steinernema carpocapsae TaxID=34508 RepID=A0A4U5MDV7_STECR|nr:hypothetical protein L596_023495 [Steinernema carpocapsae]